MAHILSYAIPRVKLFAATVIENSINRTVWWPKGYYCNLRKIWWPEEYIDLMRGPILNMIMEVFCITDEPWEGRWDDSLGRYIPAEWHGGSSRLPTVADLESLQPVKYEVLAHGTYGSGIVDVVLQLKTKEMLDAERKEAERAKTERAKTVPTEKNTVLPWDELPFYGTECPGQEEEEEEELFTPEGPTFFLCPYDGTRSVKEVVVFKDDVYGDVVVMSCSPRPPAPIPFPPPRRFVYNDPTIRCGGSRLIDPYPKNENGSSAQGQL
jgi:hypothetical protein